MVSGSGHGKQPRRRKGQGARGQDWKLQSSKPQTPKTLTTLKTLQTLNTLNALTKTLTTLKTLQTINTLHTLNTLNSPRGPRLPVLSEGEVGAGVQGLHDTVPVRCLVLNRSWAC